MCLIACHRESSITTDLSFCNIACLSFSVPLSVFADTAYSGMTARIQRTGMKATEKQSLLMQWLIFADITLRRVGLIGTSLCTCTFIE